MADRERAGLQAVEVRGGGPARLHRPERERRIYVALYTDKPYHSFRGAGPSQRPGNPTLSGRQTSWRRSRRFSESGAAVPTARPPLPSGRNIRSRLVSPHTRYGIHSTWRSNKYMMRLQRSAADVYLNPALAKRKGSRTATGTRSSTTWGVRRDGEDPSRTPPARSSMDHAWEPHQFKGKSGMDARRWGLLSPARARGYGWGYLEVRRGVGPDADGRTNRAWTWRRHRPLQNRRGRRDPEDRPERRDLGRSKAGQFRPVIFHTGLPSSSAISAVSRGQEA